MNDPITIIDTETGPIIETLDYSEMTLEELTPYVVLGREDAIAEVLRREAE